MLDKLTNLYDTAKFKHMDFSVTQYNYCLY